MDKIPVIIDLDWGDDDAIALMLALAGEGLDIRGVTVVAGKNTMESNTDHILGVLEHFGRDIGVYQGARGPMLGCGEIPPDSPGQAGLDCPGLPARPRGRAREKNALQFLEDELPLLGGRAKIIALGPLTNLGILLAAAPELKASIAEIIICGGAAQGGNRTPTAEFNIWRDPEAAHIVFSSGIPLTMCGLDVTRQATLMAQEVERIRNMGGRAAALAGEILDFHGQGGEAGWALHHAVGVALALKPCLFHWERLNVIIDLDGQYTRGCSVTDLSNVTGNVRNAAVVLSMEREGFVVLLAESLEKLNGLTREVGHD